MTAKKAPSIAFLSDEEDAAITAAALLDTDNPPLTDAELARLRPLAEALPGIAVALANRPGRPRKEAPKVALSLRLDPDLVAAMRISGRGWQARVNATLRQTYGLDRSD